MNMNEVIGEDVDVLLLGSKAHSKKWMKVEGLF
jgi:hypothetical protein